MTHELDAIRDLSVDSVRRYLSIGGWSGQGFAGRRFFVYALPGADGEDPIEIVIPATSDQEGAASEMYSALRTLSQLQDRSVDDVAREIRSLTYDIIRSRVPDEYVRHESVDLKLATEFLAGMKKFLGSAATTEMRPGRFFSRTLKEGIEYAATCRFGHTFRGSFGFVVESPVGLNSQPELDWLHATIPFSRRVVERIVRGFRTVNNALNAEDSSVISRDYSTGFNANMCDDIARILEETGVNRFDFAIDFTPEWRTSTDLVESRRFSIGQRHREILTNAAKTLREQERTRYVTVVGRVKRLETEGNPADLLNDNSDRAININWDSPDYGIITVQILLRPEDYLVAVEAHKSGRLVSARGLLEHLGRPWTLREPVDFTLVG